MYEYENPITFANPFASFEVKPVSKPWVYITSRYSLGDKLQNTLDQFQVADELLRLGFHPMPPLWTHFWDQISPKPYDTWMAYDKETISRCDCLLRLPGISPGADMEVAFALEIGLPAFYSIQEIREYYG